MPHTSSIRLSRHHYTRELILAGLTTFSIKPITMNTLEHGDTELVFESERTDIAQAFANHLLAIRRQ